MALQPCPDTLPGPGAWARRHPAPRLRLLGGLPWLSRGRGCPTGGRAGQGHPVLVPWVLCGSGYGQMGARCPSRTGCCSGLRGPVPGVWGVQRSPVGAEPCPPPPPPPPELQLSVGLTLALPRWLRSRLEGWGGSVLPGSALSPGRSSCSGSAFPLARTSPI